MLWCENSFRPLSGNYISQFGFHSLHFVIDKSFPSPVGELHFSINIEDLNVTNETVSVPCRGTTFLNGICKYHCCVLFYKVSVPCRGTTFLNCNGRLRSLKKIKTPFPSPVGELHFSMIFDVFLLIKGLRVSVPCRGTTFLNSRMSTNNLPSLLFPSPVGELHFSIWKQKENKK